jgi:phosphoribosylaminoimidazole-succinocarboxamide synthase
MAVASRATVVRRLKPLPIEAVVRGYLIGSGYKDYQATGAVCGIPLPTGLPLAAPLPEPLFTPATKAALGDHDENISFAECEKLVGATWRPGAHATLRLYTEARPMPRRAASSSPTPSSSSASINPASST